MAHQHMFFLRRFLTLFFFKNTSTSIFVFSEMLHTCPNYMLINFKSHWQILARCKRRARETYKLSHGSLRPPKIPSWTFCIIFLSTVTVLSILSKKCKKSLYLLYYVILPLEIHYYCNIVGYLYVSIVIFLYYIFMLGCNLSAIEQSDRSWHLNNHLIKHPNYFQKTSNSLQVIHTGLIQPTFNTLTTKPMETPLQWHLPGKLFFLCGQARHVSCGCSNRNGSCQFYNYINPHIFYHILYNTFIRPLVQAMVNIKDLCSIPGRSTFSHTSHFIAHYSSLITTHHHSSLITHKTFLSTPTSVQFPLSSITSSTIQHPFFIYPNPSHFLNNSSILIQPSYHFIKP
ncbi:putative signal peptide protein [Puccinia sorghi]|uniref:Putative signal peptide protein n=1 Tax=Puccinia sorghi TaxID=27349 RepID=A0A0L6VJ61_9BASI|nr:putative signal peptide protein [Puccinia sorghi]